MKLLNSALLMSFVAVMLAAPIVMAETGSPAEVLAACKKEAAANEVPMEDMQAYLRGCMEDYGVDAADVDNTLNEMAPAPEGDGGGQG